MSFCFYIFIFKYLFICCIKRGKSHNYNMYSCI